jgi:hypothetical protein
VWLFDGIKQIVGTAGAVPPAGDPADPDSQRHSKYHKRIVFVGACFAVIGLLTSGIVANDVKSGRDIRGSSWLQLCLARVGLCLVWSSCVCLHQEHS